MNVVLVRFEDWSRFRTDGAVEASVLDEGVAELAGAVGAFAARSTSPLIVVVCPPSSRVLEDPARLDLHAAMTSRLQAEIAGLASVHWLGSETLDLEAIGPIDDPRRDEIGHMPYTPLGYTAIAGVVARRIDAIKSPRVKVVALDCDNTLWKGVVGEDGPHGLTFPPGIRALHESVVAMQEAGLVVCLLSKNVEADVEAVFEARGGEMLLKREHVATHRVNWLPKSENIAEIAQELNLGLDSFVFVDDNPVECAEMRARRPEVLTLNLPEADDEIAGFLRRVWAFDVLQVTEEDRRRTAMYRQNAERAEFARGSGGIEAFLAGLQLKIEIDSPSEDELARVAQLTQKTNQFNVTTRRRDEASIRNLNGKECLRVKVADRFGDYGLVGGVIFGETGEAIEVDSFLLSCRVLGRGVEHAMLARVGRIARERGKAWVVAPFLPTAKNEPALKFLESVGSLYRERLEDRSIYRFPVNVAESLVYSGSVASMDQHRAEMTTRMRIILWVPLVVLDQCVPTLRPKPAWKTLVEDDQWHPQIPQPATDRPSTPGSRPSCAIPDQCSKQPNRRRRPAGPIWKPHSKHPGRPWSMTSPRSGRGSSGSTGWACSTTSPAWEGLPSRPRTCSWRSTSGSAASCR